MKYYDSVANNPAVIEYLKQADKNFKALGYTEQGLLHAQHTAELVDKILNCLNYSLNEIDIAKVAGFLHDIGCAIAYPEHARSGAIMSKIILNKIGLSFNDILRIISIIGSHEDIDMIPISDLAAAVMMADKTDVRRERVIKTDFKFFDQHDRVHYAVVSNILEVSKNDGTIKLRLKIDDSICSVLEYFELFFSRIEFCKKAAGKLGLRFELYINEIKYL
ncbi:MAG: HD domain-containing protein [Endomicrobia bacterium]|nr:HD domain-containing protein [Endomicrobiia bacterium]MDW8056482.1 HD domain-containing protein [Elusimicrobiota bacterium]